VIQLAGAGLSGTFHYSMGMWGAGRWRLRTAQRSPYHHLVTTRGKTETARAADAGLILSQKWISFIKQATYHRVLRISVPLGILGRQLQQDI